MREQVTEFLDHLVYERGLAANTRVAYESDLMFFVDFLQRHTRTRELTMVTRSQVHAFLADQQTQGCNAATRARRLAALKTFYKYLVDEAELAQTEITQMALPRKGQRLPRTLSEDEVAKLLHSIEGNSILALRDRSMLELLYACGLRVSELINLRLGDVRLDENIVQCTGKGQRQRHVPLGEVARQWLLRYLNEARPRLAARAGATETLYLTNRAAGITRQGVFAMLKRRAAAAGLHGRVSPHVLRHCFATHLLTHGAQIRAIQEMLGHVNIGTTQIYTHVDQRHIAGIHQKFHPRH